MKKLFLLPILLLSVTVIAQKEINASEVFRLINEGKTVDLKDALIVGELDLTELDNKESVNKSKDYREYKSYVKAPVSFINCVFEGDVIAYKNTQDGKVRKQGEVTVTWKGDSETSSTNFNESVVFENCVFKKKCEFKYSTFKEAVNFEGTTFVESANFKYAKFQEQTGFGNCTFNNSATFKYAKFSQDADFFKNRFFGYADFKYAEFGNRVTFKRANFDDYADFKYTKIEKDAVFTDANFASEPDFKYTKGKRYMN